MNKNQKERMLKIGEFSRLCQVTVKTLHHYDELGLLKPSHIDKFTSYRYYTVEQLPRIHRIMALKELGLSLEEIGLMLRADLPTEQIRGMLRLKQAELQQHVRDARRQLAMIEFRLRMIEAETTFPILDIVIKRLEPLRVLSLFVEEHHSMANVAQAIREAIDNGVVQFTGIGMDLYHGETILPLGSPDLDERQHELILSVRSSQEAVMLEGIGYWTVREEPAIEQAATLMINGGDPFKMAEKVTLLRRWALAQGYKPGDLVRYWSHRGPLHTLNVDEFVIEAQLPLAATEASN